ncbi:MAG: YceI family protein [Bdellovibrionaceae bacterium]|nr:YceI family protein [Pseudobdellovibrionaceae bacterium]
MRAILFLMCLCGIFTWAQASVMSFNKKEGKTQFLATGNPGFLKINGKGEGPEGEVKVEGHKLNGVLKVKVDSLVTGIALRDKHLKETYLKAAEHPYIELHLKDVALPEGAEIGVQDIKAQKAQALLTLNNVTKPVVLEYSIDKSKKITAKFDLKITDFKIDLPTFMKVTVADEVVVNVESKIKTL